MASDSFEPIEAAGSASLKGTNTIAQGKGEARDPGNATQPAADPEGVEQTTTDVAPLQGANPINGAFPDLESGIRNLEFRKASLLA